MKNLRIFIKKKNLEKLRAFADESYLYNYIVNNSSELEEDNVFRNATFITQIEDTSYLYIENLNEDDIQVWEEVCYELNRKRVSYYAVLTDTNDGSFFVFNNFKKDIPHIVIDKEEKVVDLICRIEGLDSNIYREMQYEKEDIEEER